MPLPRALARFNRVVTNRLARPLAGHLPLTAVIEHRGRRTGRRYRTPVLVFGRDGGYRIALTYGPRTDWVRNVLAAGGCTLHTRGRRIDLVDPVLGRDPAVRWAPPGVRTVLRTTGSVEYLDAAVAPSAARPGPPAPPGPAGPAPIT
ncbi:nitroreductase family deazaflavin-dependent oxidoreductase [Rhodococcus sp. 2H158]